MSIQCPALFLIPVVTACLWASPVQAQDGSASASDVFDRQKAMFGIPSRKPRCDQGAAAEIVVCAQDEADFRAKPSSEVDPESKQALDNGELHAPDFGKRCRKGTFGCITGGFAPPPIFIIDLEAIPEAPVGSDADKVARGELRDR